MKIIFIRHGNPDYEADCLTELGHKQAEAVADVLCTMGIAKIYASSHGRCLQTAEYTASRLGLEIHKCDFIRELTSRLKADPTCPFSAEFGPWARTEEYKRRRLPLLDKNWRFSEPFADIDTPERIDRLCIQLDEWLFSLGLEREGLYYKIKNPGDTTVAMFCHVMSYSASLAHIFNLTYPFVCVSLSMPQTGITVVEFSGEPGEVVIPKLLKVGNIDHLINNNIEITGA